MRASGWLAVCTACPGQDEARIWWRVAASASHFFPLSPCWGLFSVATETNSPVKILTLFKSKSATFPENSVLHCICMSCFFGCLGTSINRVLSLILLFYSMLVICALCLSSTNQGMTMLVLWCRTFKVQANPLFRAEMNQMLSTDPLLNWGTRWVIFLLW